MPGSYLVDEEGTAITSTNPLPVTATLGAGTALLGKVDIASALPAGTNTIGAVKIDVPKWTVVRSIGDYTTQQTAATLWDPAADKKFVITDILVSTATAGTITLIDDSTAIRKYTLAANGGVVENLVSHEMSAAANNVLKITTSAAMTCFVVVKGYEV